MGDFVAVAKTEDVKDGETRVVDVNGVAVALYNVKGEFYATQNECIHQQGPLGEGALEEEVVTCPWHGWKYDVKTGVSPVNPEAKLKTFPTKVEDGTVLVSIE